MGFLRQHRFAPYLLLFLSLTAVAGELPLLKIDPDFAGEDRGEAEIFKNKKVVYFRDPVQKAKNEIHFKDGKLFTADHRLLDTSHGMATTVRGEFRTTWNTAIVVLDQNGKLYYSLSPERGKIHHSSLVSGENVRFAGEIQVKDGVLQGITNFSGHYSPSVQHTHDFIEQLEQHGVSMKNVILREETLTVKRFLNHEHDTETMKKFIRYSLEDTFTMGNHSLYQEWFKSHLPAIAPYLNAPDFFHALDQMETSLSPELERQLFPLLKNFAPSEILEPGHAAILKKSFRTDHAIQISKWANSRAKGGFCGIPALLRKILKPELNP